MTEDYLKSAAPWGPSNASEFHRCKTGLWKQLNTNVSLQL